MKTLPSLLSLNYVDFVWFSWTFNVHISRSVVSLHVSPCLVLLPEGLPISMVSFPCRPFVHMSLLRHCGTSRNAHCGSSSNMNGNPVLRDNPLYSHILNKLHLGSCNGNFASCNHSILTEHPLVEHRSSRVPPWYYPVKWPSFHDCTVSKYNAYRTRCKLPLIGTEGESRG